jgi:glycosyltransferase involved in cell wall biosynthesis
MRIAFVCEFDINDPNRRSGVPYFMAKGFRELGHEVIQIGPFQTKRLLINRIKNGILTTIFNKILKGKKGNIVNMWSKEWLENYSKQAEEKLKGLDYDIVFSPESHTIAYLTTNKPIIFWRDATFDNLLNYYLFNLHPLTIKQGRNSEIEAIKKSSLTIYTSKWAADSAIKNYNAKHTYIVERGANLINEPNKEDVLNAVNKKIEAETLQLLFIAADWERKGGDKVVEIAEKLNNLGIQTILNIAGKKPNDHVLQKDFVQYHGFIKKNTLEGVKVLENLYAQSHFFIMLSAAENFGIVYAEASAFGVPSIAFDTGGISSAVHNNENGFLFEQTATIAIIANKIAVVRSNKNEYKKLCFLARNAFEQRLNWKTNCQRVIDLINKTKTN